MDGASRYPSFDAAISKEKILRPASKNTLSKLQEPDHSASSLDLSALSPLEKPLGSISSCYIISGKAWTRSPNDTGLYIGTSREDIESSCLILELSEENSRSFQANEEENTSLIDFICMAEKTINSNLAFLNILIIGNQEAVIPLISFYIARALNIKPHFLPGSFPSAKEKMDKKASTTDSFAAMHPPEKHMELSDPLLEEIFRDTLIEVIKKVPNCQIQINSAQISFFIALHKKLNSNNRQERGPSRLSL